VIPNGFDDADFSQAQSAKLDAEFTIAHIGSMNKDRNPEVFWQALQAALSSNAALAQYLKIRLIGPADFSVRESVQRYGLQAYTEFIDFVPHAEAVQYQQQSQVLLLLINHSPNARTIIPGKLYEYLGSGRPLLTIGPKDSDSAKVIELTKGGALHAYEDLEGLKNSILHFFEAYQKGALQGSAEGIQQFTRRHLAGKFAELLSNLR
jgi:glycosyltransferase involved in cell wall biosynthesis